MDQKQRIGSNLNDLSFIKMCSTCHMSDIVSVKLSKIVKHIISVGQYLVKERMEAYEFNQEMIDSFCTDSILTTDSPSKFTARFTQPSHNFINAG